MAKLLVEFEFDCPYVCRCPRFKERREKECHEKMTAIIFKQCEGDHLYSWLPLVNFCDYQPERQHVINALRAKFGPDTYFELKKKSVLERR